ncbi:MAG TPA: glycosyltransferase [Saprospiraceae bacterium]|nr:glycosyltransferase [Lewinellaceae bacterium]HRX29143.1 glycosyltransferase [Saprospiraceae bacterium]
MVTIYITNFNYAKYLEKAILSVLNQSYQKFELFIIDDGSTDNSREIIEKYRAFNNIEIIYQQNKGLNVSNNIALRLANGDYIMRLDADDYLVNNAVELLVKELDHDESLGLIFPDYYQIDSNEQVIERHKRHDFKEDVSLYDQAAHGACTMIRVSYLRDIGGYNENYTCQDGYDLWVRFIQKYKVKNLNIPLFYYRQHGSNLTSNEQKILSTRAQINSDFINHHGINVDSVAIVPIRVHDFSSCLIKVGSETLIDLKIGQVLNSKSIKKLILCCESEDILKYVSSKFLVDPKFQFFLRSQKASAFNEPLETSLNEILSDVGEINSRSIIFLDIKFPFIKSIHIDDAINTLHLFGSDSLISVRLFTNSIFKHDGSGMKPAFKSDGITKLEREQLYEHVGGLTVVNMNYYKKNKKIIAGKVGHTVLDFIASFKLDSKVKLKIANTILMLEKND